MKPFQAPPADMHPDHLLKELLEHDSRIDHQGSLEPERFKDYCDRCVDQTGPGILSDGTLWMALSEVQSALHGLEVYYFGFEKNDNGGLVMRPIVLDPVITPTFEQIQDMAFVARAAAEGGLPLEDKSKFGHIIVIPEYDWSKNPVMLNGVIAVLKADDVLPVKERDWLEALYNASLHTELLHRARDKGLTRRHYPQPTVPRDPNIVGTWRSIVSKFLTREAALACAEELAAGLWSPEGMSEFLADAAWQLGAPDPSKLHPKRLFQKLEKAAESGKLLAMTQSALQTATNLTSAAMSQTWVNTLKNVFGGMTMVIPDAELVFFLASGHWRDFKLAHDLPSLPDPKEAQALQLIAQWTALAGKPVHDGPKDKRAIFQNLRKVMGVDAPIVAIPVFAWEVGKVEDPNLHGVFIAIRNKEAQDPPPMVMVAWTLAAQYFLSPLSAAKDAGLFEYTPLSMSESHYSASTWGGESVAKIREQTEEFWKRMEARMDPKKWKEYWEEE